MGTRFPSGMLVYAEGDACSAIAFLLSGEIRVCKTGEGGREITLYEIGRGETCILATILYPANAVSVREGSMLLIPADDFRSLMEKAEEMRRFVFEIMNDSKHFSDYLIESISKGNMPFSTPPLKPATPFLWLSAGIMLIYLLSFLFTYDCPSIRTKKLFHSPRSNQFVKLKRCY